MSISLYVDGYTVGAPATDEASVRAGDVFTGSSVVFDCGDGIPCVGAGGFGDHPPVTQTASVAALASAFPDASFFAVLVRITTPGLDAASAGGKCREPPIGLYRCVSQADDVLFTVGYRWLYDLSVGTESPYSPVAGDLDLRDPATTPVRGELTDRVYLFNDAPTYTVPDAGGNEIGRVLFDLGDLPSSVSVTCQMRFMAFNSGGENQRLSIETAVYPYYPNDVPPVSAEGLMCVL